MVKKKHFTQLDILDPNFSVGHKIGLMWARDLHFFKNWSSGVRALPVAAGTNEGGHYFRYFSTLVVLLVVETPIAFTPEGIVVGFQIFAWAPK